MRCVTALASVTIDCLHAWEQRSVHLGGTPGVQRIILLNDLYVKALWFQPVDVYVWQIHFAWGISQAGGHVYRQYELPRPVPQTVTSALSKRGSNKVSSDSQFVSSERVFQGIEQLTVSHIMQLALPQHYIFEYADSVL